MNMFNFLLAKQGEGFALSSGGELNSGSSSKNEKTSFSLYTVTAGTALGTARNAAAAAGTKTTGYIIGGRVGYSYFSSSEKYQFASDGRTSGASLGTARWGLAGCGNLTVGIFSGGYTTDITDKYTYSSDTRAAGTATKSAWGVGATSNDTVGIFASGWSDPLGSQTKTTRIYTFSNDAVSNGTDLTTATFGVFGASSRTIGYFMGGVASGNVNVSLVDKYKFSDNTKSTGGSLSTARHTASASANHSKIIVSAGAYFVPSETKIRTTEIYFISSDSFSAGTDLSENKQWVAGVSSTPGHI